MQASLVRLPFQVWPSSSSRLLQAAAPHRPAHQPGSLRVKTTAAAAPGDALTLNISKAVDKEHEGKSFRELTQLPPSALQGLKAGKADDALAAFKIKTIEDLANWRYPKLARAIALLAKAEVEGARQPGAQLNINAALDKGWENKSLKELLEAPPSALQGLAAWADTSLAALKIKTVADLAKWKYATWAEAITTLAAYERSEGAHR